MQAWQLERMSLDGLTRRELPTPRIAAHQVLVRVRAVSINPHDVHVARGAFGPMPLPLIPLADGAGEVVEVGPSVTRIAVGARVIGTFVQGWISGRLSSELRATALGGPRAGVLAEYAVFDEAAVVVVPDALSFEEAATLPIAGATAWSALFGEASVRPGHTVVVQGTGGVSMFAIQLAAAAGARVISLSSDDAKLAVARSHGASATINYRAVPDWDRQVRALTDGVGADLVVDVAGALQASINATRTGGQVSVIGLLAGTRTEIDIVSLLAGNVRLQGIQTGSRAVLAEVVHAFAQRGLRPVIHRRYTFDDAPRAYAAIAEHQSYIGKLVIEGAP